MAAPTVLAFNLDAFAQDALAGICAAMNLRLRAVPKAERGTSIGALAGLPNFGASNANAADDFDSPMLVMCWMEEPVFSVFLTALRASPVLRIPLKAVLTPTNAAWNAAALYRELAREHAEMRRRRQSQ